MPKSKVFKCKLTAYKHEGKEIKLDVEPKRLIRLLTTLPSKKGRELCLMENSWTEKNGKKTIQCVRYGIIGGWKNHWCMDTPTHIFYLEDDTISFEDNISQHYVYQFESIQEAYDFWQEYVTNSIYKVH